METTQTLSVERLLALQAVLCRAWPMHDVTLACSPSVEGQIANKQYARPDHLLQRGTHFHCTYNMLAEALLAVFSFPKLAEQICCASATLLPETGHRRDSADSKVLQQLLFRDYSLCEMESLHRSHHAQDMQINNH